MIDNDRFSLKILAKEWVEYPITLASIAIAKDLIFCSAIAELSVNGTLNLFPMDYFYRPQQSCGQGYVFTRVCDSIHRGVSGQGDPPEQTPPGEQTPQSRHPQEQTPPGKHTPAYGQWAAGMHPTGMHSCSHYFCQWHLRSFNIFVTSCVNIFIGVHSTHFKTEKNGAKNVTCKPGLMASVMRVMCVTPLFQMRDVKNINVETKISS